MEKPRIIIDNDGGTDDYIAIAYAILSGKFDIEAITVVAGNTNVENVLKNVFHALEKVGVSPEKAKKIGIHIPEFIKQDIISDGAQGENGLGNIDVQNSNEYRANSEFAEDVLVKKVKENPGEITIVATGPLTNIANAMKADPTFAQNIKEIVIMGGDEGGGNITPKAEFNVYQDPEAAKFVFDNAPDKITMIGFNVSKKVNLSPEIIDWLQNNTEFGQLLEEMTRITEYLDVNKNSVDGASMNDVLTLEYLVNPSIFTSKRAAVQVDTSEPVYDSRHNDISTRGQTVISEADEGAKSNVITGVDQTKALEELFSVFFIKPENLEKPLLENPEGFQTALEARALRVEKRDAILAMIPEHPAFDELRHRVNMMCNRRNAPQALAKFEEYLKKVAGAKELKERLMNKYPDRQLDIKVAWGNSGTTLQGAGNVQKLAEELQEEIGPEL